jgi:capsular exopolysaccharide synthesis family protein
VAEAYRGLNTNVRFLLAAGGPNASDAATTVRLGRVVMVTSASPAEGKTSVAANLAVAAARVGMRVILVDGDLRSPALHRYFGLDAPRGLADLLRESGPLSEHLLDVGVDNLSLLAAGSIPPNPTDLLASSRCARLWQDLRQVADLIIVDTAPLLRVVDGMEVAGNADVIVLVARDRVSHEHQVQTARQRLSQVGGRVSGIVINAVPTKWSSFDYDYGVQQTQNV